MSDLKELTNEKIIKSKKRIQNHGEVFTPKRIVKNMLDLPNIREACRNLTSTFLEPAAGEGAFLIEVLSRKLDVAKKNYGEDLSRYENYSLLALSSLYGIELLEDNSQKCVMNLYQVYLEAYQKQVMEHNKKAKSNVLDSAKLIISKNIAQGNFLTKLSANGKPIVFSEWQPVKLNNKTKSIKVHRTEYELNEIIEGVEKKDGESSSQLVKVEQLDLFDYVIDEEVEETNRKKMKYVPVKITEVYKEEMEEIDG